MKRYFLTKKMYEELGNASFTHSMSYDQQGS
jgi:hypothetical protein